MMRTSPEFDRFQPMFGLRGMSNFISVRSIKLSAQRISFGGGDLMQRSADEIALSANVTVSNYLSASPTRLVRPASIIDPAPACAGPNAAGISVPEPPIPGDCQHREQQQGNNFFRV
jgi:hypothetical protein